MEAQDVRGHRDEHLEDGQQQRRRVEGAGRPEHLLRAHPVELRDGPERHVQVPKRRQVEGKGGQAHGAKVERRGVAQAHELVQVAGVAPPVRDEGGPGREGHKGAQAQGRDAAEGEARHRVGLGDGFEEAEGRFPSAVAEELAASDATWDEFFKRNSLEEEEGAEGEAARGQRLDEWLRGGGIGRLLKWVGAHPEEAVGAGNAKDEALRRKRAARLATN